MNAIQILACGLGAVGLFYMLFTSTTRQWLSAMLAVVCAIGILFLERVLH